MNKSANNTHIMDFNQAIGAHDVLAFTKDLFASTSALAVATCQRGSDVVIAQGTCNITIHDAIMQDVLSSAIIL